MRGWLGLWGCGLSLSLFAWSGCSPAPTPSDPASNAAFPPGTPPPAASSTATPQPPTLGSDGRDALAGGSNAPLLGGPPATPTASVAPPVMCTKIGCQSELVLAPGWGPDTLTASKYAFELTVDGKKGRCEVYYPYPSCDKPREPRCSGDVAFTLQTGCNEKGEMRLGPLRLHGTPEKVGIKIWREKNMWHQSEITPAYKDTRPNGPDCDPVCKRSVTAFCIGECKRGELAAAVVGLE